MDIIHALDTEMESRLLELRRDGLKRGESPGFPTLYEHYSLKEGSTTYIISPPAAGKSSLVNEIMMNLAEFSDWKWVVFSPETGSPRDLFAELLWVKLRKPFLANPQFSASDIEATVAMNFIKEHFFILDPMQLELNEKMFYKAVIAIEKENGIKINGAVIDPITDFAIDTKLRADIALGGFLTNIRKFSSTYGIHTIIAFHTSAMGFREGKAIDGSRVRYLPPPTMFDIAGGQMASRKGMMILSLFRTPYGVIDEATGLPYEAHETRVLIQKAKPKTIGKVGEVVLYFDRPSSRFYEKHVDGTRIYSSRLTPEDLISND